MICSRSEEVQDQSSKVKRLLNLLALKFVNNSELIMGKIKNLRKFSDRK